MSFLFNFGKKRRSVKRRSVKRRSTKKMVKDRKPSAKVLKLAKKYHVKATRKVGGRRVYKKEKLLKKEILKKVMALKKKLMRMKKLHMKSKKMHKKSKKMHKKSKKMHKKRTVRRRRHFGKSAVSAFGKRRRRVASRKVSKAAAMKAFRSFYKRHCAGARRSRFGNGGNPALSASMGYEFCPDGSGGVLGVNSTGLFPTPCGQTAAMGPIAATPPTTGSVVALYNAAAADRAYAPAGAFGAKQSRRKRGSKSRVVCRRVRHRVRKYNVAGSPCNKLKKADCRGKKECLYVKRRGCRRSGRSHAAAVAAMAAPMPVAAAYGRRR
jgi:hypothetical protein